VGEKITVTFSDLPHIPPPHEQNIREDGTITLPFGVTLRAAGKTPGQLEDEIREAYVPRIYLRLTPIVTADERTISVGGEVKISNRQHYTDRTTVLRAIQAAGDFSDFADRRKIELIRANGQKFYVDWYKAKENSALDLEVFPGDQIIVGKRIW
jgi:polysaccharide export outer membrane protein